MPNLQIKRDLEERISIASVEKTKLMSNFDAVTSNLNSAQDALSKMEKTII